MLQSDVERVVFVEQVQSVDSEEEVVGYESRIDLKSCADGQLVVAMSRLCRQKTFYTTGGCRIPGG